MPVVMVTGGYWRTLNNSQGGGGGDPGGWGRGLPGATPYLHHCICWGCAGGKTIGVTI